MMETEVECKTCKSMTNFTINDECCHCSRVLNETGDE